MPTHSTMGLAALLHAVGGIESFVESRLAAASLSLPKLAALCRLVEAGDALPLGQLAERLACVKSNVTQLVDRLEADGLVTRAPDPTDRRSRLAIITDAGREAYRAGMRIQSDAEEQLFGALSDEDEARLVEIMNKLRSAHKAQQAQHAQKDRHEQFERLKDRSV
jgi:DNA-binding MarR family transcriptional regulator